MKVYVAGTRGFPGIMGGVETHCKELYTRMACDDIDITVARRTPYINDTNRITSLDGVKFDDISTPKSKHLEAIVHTFKAMFHARHAKADILHIHGIGPGLITPLAKMLGLKVVLTVHSFNYDHDKWNRLAKGILRLGEWVSIRWADRVISISNPIKKSLEQRYNKRDIRLIYNGVNEPTFTTSHDWLDRWGAGARPYILAVGRLTPEKGFHDLVEAYTLSGLQGKIDLIIAGDCDHPTLYSDNLKRKASEAGVIMPGVVRGMQLAELYSHACLFAIPSYHEGLPIAMLEAMSYKLNIVASDIEPNRIGLLDESHYFPTGDTHALANKLVELTLSPASRIDYDLTPYNWDTIATATTKLYRELINK